MSFFRYILVLTLVFWIGGIIFFAFVEAPAAFAVIPARNLAGNVVARSINSLHWMGIICGLIFLLASFIYAYLSTGGTHPFAARNLLVVIMLALTLISQFGIIPRMDSLRASIGTIDSVPPSNPARMQFDALHVWSTRVEGAVLLLGLALIYLTAQQLATGER